MEKPSPESTISPNGADGLNHRDLLLTGKSENLANNNQKIIHSFQALLQYDTYPLLAQTHKDEEDQKSELSGGQDTMFFGNFARPFTQSQDLQSTCSHHRDPSLGVPDHARI